MSVLSVASTMTSLATKPKKQKKTPYYKPASFPATQDSEDDMPSMSQLVRDRGPGKSSSFEEIDDDDDEEVEPQPRGRGGPQRKRNLVVDGDESDE